MAACRIWRILLLISSILPFAAALAAADQADGSAPVTYSIGNEFPCAANAFHRAGHPECVRRWAIPSDNYRYGGYYVGGGLPVRGEQRCVFHEGTWGWDYFGILFPKNISLNWGHGRRDQGGAGAYKTDGPKIRHE